MSPALDRLALRRDVFIRLAKILLICTTIVWLVLMALYDRAADGWPANTILLPTRTTYMLWAERIPALDLRRIWGGPTTLFGAQCLIGTFATISFLAFVRTWLNRAKVSWLGVGFAIASSVLALPVVAAGSGAIYPVEVEPADFARLTTAIQKSQPGLIERLRAGEHLGLPRTSGAVGRLRMSETGHLVAVVPDGTPLLRDSDDAESLRFALAQQAWLAGDQAALRRLLPIALTMPPTDLPARNDIAQRLTRMGEVAGAAPVPGAQADVVAARTRTWQRRLAMTHYARLLLHLLLWSGLSCLVIGLILRWSHDRIESRTAALEAMTATPRRNRGIAGITTP